MKKQVAHLSKGNKQEENVRIRLDRRNKITDIDLNELSEGQRFYFKRQNDMIRKEFLVYSVSFKNFKRVLTLRTEYLLENRTSHTYHLQLVNHELKN